MNKLSVNPYKGARDFYPVDKRIQKYIFQKMRNVVESFGYEEYDAPIIEDISLYVAKSGQEIVSEQTYNFTDRGGRTVAIRPEMTPSVSRMVARKRQELSYPLRLYSIPNLWRYERQQKGRFREHWQLNVDIFGIKGLQADSEIINVADAIFQSFGAKRSSYQFKINSRTFIDFILQEYFKLNDEKSTKIIKLIDRFNKMPLSDFINKIDEILDDSDRSNQVPERLIKIINTKEMSDFPAEFNQSPSFQNLKTFIDQAKISIPNLTFDGTIMRGFDYYTDIIFEVNDTDPTNNRSMMGGGRYDGLVALFGVDPLPTAGFGLGDATMLNFLEGHALMPELKVETDVMVVSIGDTFSDMRQIVNQLRKSSVNVYEAEIGKKISSQIALAIKKEIPYFMVVGEDELLTNKFVLKRLNDAKEFVGSIDDLVKTIKK